MDIKIDLQRDKLVPVERDRVAALIGNVEAVLKLFPKVKKLVPLGDADYRLDLHTVGSSVARISHDISFGACCKVDTDHGTLDWAPMPRIGNATVEGHLKCAAEGEGTRVNLVVRGELRNVPVPLMYRLVAPAYIQGKFAALLDAYIDRIGTHAGHGRPRAPA